MGIKPFESGVADNKLPGMLLLNPNSKLRDYRVSYTKGRTLFRPWATMQDGKMLPWRDESGNLGTRVMVQDRVCFGWGIDFRFTCMTDVSDPSNWPGSSPLELFQSALWQSKAFPHLFESKSGGFPPLSRPKVHGFMKGVLLENAGKKYRKNPVKNAIVMFPKSARDAVAALLDQKVSADAQPGEPTPDDPHGWNAMYVVGDLTGPDAGKVIELNKESEIIEDTDDQVEMTGTGVATVPSGREQAEIENYAARIWPRPLVPNTPPGVLPIKLDEVAAVDEPFEECLQFLTGEEQLIRCILPGFKHSAKDAILFVFGGQGVLPESFEFGRTVHDMAAKKAQQQAPAQPQSAPASAPAATPQPQPAPEVPFDADEEFVNMDGMVEAGGDDESGQDAGLVSDGDENSATRDAILNRLKGLG